MANGMKDGVSCAVNIAGCEAWNLMHVSELFVYPIKSAQAVACGQLDIEPRGPRHDRRWMLVNQDGVFESLRTLPALSKLFAHVSTTGLVLKINGEMLEVAAPTGPSGRYTLWRDTVHGTDAGDAAAAFLSAHLDRPLRLVHQGAHTDRIVWQRSKEPVSFADGFPLLLITQSAVDELAERLDTAVDVRRFRPNIVVADASAHAEDEWQRVRIGELTFEVAKPCVRCTIPSMDPDSGTVAEGFNRTLAAYRRRDGQIYFGQNLIALDSGVVRADDPLEVLA